MNNISRVEVKNFLRVLKNVSSSLKVVDLNFLNKTDSSGNTILHNAVQNQDVEEVNAIIDVALLVENKNIKEKFLDMQNKAGDTAIHIAATKCEEKNLDSKARCEAIAKLLDAAGANKNIPNRGGFIVSSSESPPSASEYRDRLFKMFGGQQSPLSTNSNNSTNKSDDSPVKFVNKNSKLDNITTEVSVDNWMSRRVDNTKKKLMDLTSEVSIDNLSGGSSSSSESPLTESSSQSGGSSDNSSSNMSSSNSSSISSSESSSMTYSGSSVTGSSVTGSSVTGSSVSGGQKGGSKLTESSELSDTSTFVKSLLTQFNSMKGGSRNVRGNRILPSLSDYELSEMYGGRDFGLSREQMKESSNIHDEVVKMFMDSGKTEEEARIMKMALYKYTKDKNPELNNLDRAKKMKEYANDSKIIKSLDLTTTRKIYEDVKKSKSMMTDSDNSGISPASSNASSNASDSSSSYASSTEMTEQKPKKKTSVKKTTAKKTSAKKSK